MMGEKSEANILHEALAKSSRDFFCKDLVFDGIYLNRDF